MILGFGRLGSLAAQLGSLFGVSTPTTGEKPLVELRAASTRIATLRAEACRVVGLRSSSTRIQSLRAGF